jgi:hypothetical protein
MATSTSTSTSTATPTSPPGTGIIFGWVFLDLNGDGWRGADEQAGLPEVYLDLYLGEQPVAQVRSVGNDGWYQLAPLPAGTYCLQASIPPSHRPTTPTRVCFQHQAGADLAILFGAQKQPTGFIGDYLWYDADADGLEDVAEPGIGNVTLSLYRDNGDNTFDPQADTLVASTLSDADGGYLFRHVEWGTYFITVTDELSIVQGLTHTLGPQSQSLPFGPLLLLPGEIYRDADFGFVLKAGADQAVIGDRVWYDADADGRPDPGEPGIPGVTVCAAPLGYAAPTCATTDPNGDYRLRVAAGAYLVAPAQTPAGLRPTTPAFRAALVVRPGQHDLTVDFGYAAAATPLGRIEGLLWHDAQADGIYDPVHETTIAGVGVDLIHDADRDGIWDAGEPILATVIAGPDGRFAFAGLPAGDYLAWVSDVARALADYAATIPGPQPKTANHNQPQPYAIRLAAGATDQTASFGYVQQAAAGRMGLIGNQVWFDADCDGVFAPEERDLGVAGVTVALFTDGAASHTRTTGASGQYVFTGLAAGRYRVQVSDLFAILADYAPAPPGPQPGVDGHNQAQPYNIVLIPDQRGMTADFGYCRKPAPGQ